MQLRTNVLIEAKFFPLEMWWFNHPSCDIIVGMLHSVLQQKKCK